MLDARKLWLRAHKNAAGKAAGSRRKQLISMLRRRLDILKFFRLG